MTIENLLTESERSLQSVLNNLDILEILLVVKEVICFPDILVDLGVTGDLRGRGRGESSACGANRALSINIKQNDVSI